MHTSPGAAPAKKVSGSGYWIGSILLVLGTVIGLVLLVTAVTSLLSAVQDAPHVQVGSKGTVNLTGSGCKELNLVSPSGQLTFSTPRVRITGPSGEPLDVRSTPCPSSAANTTADFDTLFRNIGSVNISGPGAYEMDVERPSGSASGGQYVSVSPPFEQLAEDVVVRVLGGLAIGFIGFSVGLILLIVTGVRRSRARRQRYGPPPPGFAGGPPPGSWGSPPGGWGPPPGAWGPGSAPPGPPPGPSGPPPGPSGPPPAPPSGGPWGPPPS